MDEKIQRHYQYHFTVVYDPDKNVFTIEDYSYPPDQPIWSEEQDDYISTGEPGSALSISDAMVYSRLRDALAGLDLSDLVEEE